MAPSLAKLEGYVYIGSNSSVELTFENYHGWRAQWVALLNGVNLIRYVDGSGPVLHENSHIWRRQDQLILHAILLSLSEKFLMRVCHAKTSKEAWDEIENEYSSYRKRFGYSEDEGSN